jgi:glycosyltransferase involved in cell wall biosynthesis
MGFATEYLKKGALFPLLIEEAPSCNTGIAVVIPAYDEPDIGVCLSSLAACSPPPVDVEVIVVVNSPASSGTGGLDSNTATLKSLEKWRSNDNTNRFRLYVIDVGQPAIKNWGVGAARKTGMDEAAGRFSKTGREDGVIVSLDADCTVSNNYLESLWIDFGLNQKAGGCSISFEHRDNDADLDPKLADAVRQYELHLRYYIAGLKYAGFPYAFHTIGSAIAVKAIRYVKSGGMSRRQGGEDFYFIQKLVVTDDFVELKQARVFPSARLSERVPFGTGPALRKLAVKPEAGFLTYNPYAFADLRCLFNLIMFNRDEDSYKSPPFTEIPDSVKLLISATEWNSKMDELIRNTSSSTMFKKRFFTWFNAFRIVKYLNRAHEERFSKLPVSVAAFNMIEMVSGTKNTKTEKDLRELLGYFRMVDSL